MSIGKNTRKPVAAARATPKTMDNAKSDMESAYNETQRSLDVCLNRLGSKLEARAAKTALGGKADLPGLILNQGLWQEGATFSLEDTFRTANVDKWSARRVMIMVMGKRSPHEATAEE